MALLRMMIVKIDLCINDDGNCNTKVMIIRMMIRIQYYYTHSMINKPVT